MPKQISDDWNKIYSGDKPAWEIGRPQPALLELAGQGLFSGQVLDVGCGTGEHTIMAAQHGADALGVDISPVAIELASEKARTRGVVAKFAVANALDLGVLGGFDVALDSGLFHTFGEEQRLRYVASVAQVVRLGGILVITCFSEHQPGDWGPHRVTEGEIREAFRHGWVIEDLRLCDRMRRPETGHTIAKAWLATIRHTKGPKPP